MNTDDEDNGQPRTKNMTMRNKFAMTFRDVEDSIRPFSGDKKYLVIRWISDFEEVAELYGWTDIQKDDICQKFITRISQSVQGE